MTAEFVPDPSLRSGARATPRNRRIHPAVYPREEGTGPAAPPEPGARAASSRIAAMAGAVLGVVLVVGVSVGAAWSVRRYVTQSPRFAIRSFEVFGNAHRTVDALVAESGLALAENVFSTDLDSARARILADPWVADVVLTRRLPGTIVMGVTERTAAALVAIGDLYLATPRGDPFKKFEAGDPADLPVISGLTSADVDDDRPEVESTVRRAIEVAAEYDRSALARRAPLEEVHVAPNGDFTLIVGHAGTQLVLGAPPFRQKLDKAARVIAELDKRHAQASAILLDNEARPERVVARIASRP
jgi:cell division protein FtsQ